MFSSYGRTQSITAARKLEWDSVVPENIINFLFFRMLIVRLLQKIGKEIMKRCEKHINVDRVFSGFIISTKRNIDQSIRLVHSLSYRST